MKITPDRVIVGEVRRGLVYYPCGVAGGGVVDGVAEDTVVCGAFFAPTRVEAGLSGACGSWKKG